MGENIKLAAHETTDLHEIIKSSVLEIKALQQYYQQAKEPQTQSLIQNCLSLKQSQAEELQQFVKTQGILQ